MDTDEQPDGATETPSIDYRTATPEEVEAEHARLRNGEQAPHTKFDGVDWQNIPRHEYQAELAKRGVYVRRFTH